MDLHTQDTTARSWHWTGPATLEAVREASIGTRRFLSESSLPEEEVSAWELVVAEAGNNCALHHDHASTNYTLDLLVTIIPTKVILRLCDSTPGFDWPESTALPPDDSENGRGLYLIDCLTERRTYARSRQRNILELERSLPAGQAIMEDTEATLLAMTEELSSCYESLASIFHFISEARNTATLGEFATSVLEHLIQSTSSHIGILRVMQDGKLLTLALHGCEDCEVIELERQALGDCLDRWVHGHLEGFSQENQFVGLVHPFSHEKESIGTLLLLRTQGEPPFNAGEENMIRTFSEFFTQHILSRRHEEAAIRSSVARREFELAAAIQSSLLPPPLAPVCDVCVTGHCESALSIGGDFYDLIPIENHGFFFVIADVMGKGVGASMMAAVTRSVIRSLSAYYLQPATLLEMVAKQMHEDLDRLEIFVTVAVGVIDVPAGEIRIANAGHCPVVLTNGEHTLEIGPENPPVGIEAAPTYPQFVMPISPNTKILAYTDGLVDPRNARPSFDQEDDVAAWFATAAPKSSTVTELKTALLDRLEYHKDAAFLADDQTFLMLSCNNFPSPPSWQNS